MNFLYECVYKKRQWENDYIDRRVVKFYLTQTLSVADSCSKAIIVFCHTSKSTRKQNIMHFLILNEIFVTILSLVVNFLH